jgi:hypothetical protein
MTRATRTFLFVSLVLLMATPSAVANPQPAVELVVTLEKEVYRTEEPIPYSIDLINRLDIPIGVVGFRSFEGGILTSERAGALTPIAVPRSNVSQLQCAPAGGRVKVWEEEDLHPYFLMAERGQYTFEAVMYISLVPSNSTSRCEGLNLDDTERTRQFRLEHPVPLPLYSVPVTFELTGEPRIEDLAASRWRKQCPETCRLGWRTHSRGTKEIAISSTAGGGNINFYTGTRVRPSEDGRDWTGTRRTFQVELLGKSRRWGPVWAQYEPEVDEHWPEWREAAREAFFVKK